MFDLGRTFLAAVERDPQALAIVDGQRRLSYADWYAEVSRVAAGLASLGLGRGDRIAVILPNRLEMATLHWACQFLGLMVSPLNWRLKADEIDYCLGDAGARAVVFDAVAASAVAASAAAQAIPRIAVDGAAGGTMGFAEWPVARPVAPQAEAEDLSLLLYTSGTTGRPKGVPRRHRAERAAAVAHVAQNLYGRGERTLGVMPLYHTMGVRSLLAMALVDGTFVCLPRFDAGAALGLIAREQVTNLYLVPTLYHDLIEHRGFATTDTHSVTKLGFAGAAMPEGLLNRVEAAFRPRLFVNHYGSSEIYTFTIEPRAAAKPGSAGRAGINQRVRVVRLDAGPNDVAAPGEEGEIIADMTNDEAFDGYWRRPDADAKALRDGWYFTGDTGYVDADGDVFVTGRVDDMIISGGENVSPGEIESVLSLHPAVAEVAVAGLPDERWGQRITAFIRRAPGAVDAAALDQWCRQSNLADYKRPRDYVFVAEVPKSPVGKILRRLLVAGDYRKE